MSRFAVLLLVLLAASTAALASGYIEVERRLTPAQMHETGLDTLSKQQLAALNRVLREEATARPPVAAAPAERFDPTRHAGLDDAPIRSRVKGTVAGWAPGTLFELENGQQWKVLKGSLTLPKPVQAPEIVVVPGIAGRWFLQVDEDLPKARVYRVD